MRILIAPNAFKGCLGATQVADTIARGFAASPLACRTVCHPVGDGGDGTAELLAACLADEKVEVGVGDPLGRPITARIAFASGSHTAIIGMADASGLRLLGADELDPLEATSFGTGELMVHALDRGARRILLGVGGSATVEGGTGIARALGVRFLDGAGNDLPPSPKALVDLAAIDRSRLNPRLADCQIDILCDVDNRLLGTQGAAAVFGPQKGARPADVALLERGLERLAKVLLEQTRVDVRDLARGGAAGGVAAGLHALFGAKLVSGIDHFLDLTGFDDMLGNADLVITGEGAIDDQTLAGKAPYGVAVRARARAIPVIAMAGRVPLPPSFALREAFDALVAIGEGPATLPDALDATARNLERSAHEIGALLAIGSSPDERTR